MNFAQVVKDSTVYLETLITGTDGSGVTGLSVGYSIYQCSDNSLVTSGTLTDKGNGVYQASTSFSNLGQYRILYTTPAGNGIETMLVVNQPAEQATLNDYGDILKRILGLSHENFRIFDPEFDRNHNLVGGLIKIYDSAVDCENDTNAIAEYEMDARYILKNNRVSTYKMKRIV